MRRKHLATMVLILPLANALSLANFQQITSVLIPLSCTLEYNSQISSCTVDDFNKGCSNSCKKGLKRVAESVSDACSGVILNPKSLLGIVKVGGILNALCPQYTQPTTTAEQPAPTTAPVESTTPPAQETSVPPSSETSRRSTTKTSTSVSSTRSVIETSPESTATPETTVTPTTTEFANGSGDTTSMSSSATATSTAGSRDNGSGGGSPFDITSGASHDVGGSILNALILGGWSFLLFGR